MLRKGTENSAAALVAVFLFLTGLFDTASAAPEKHALLIGIENYPGGEVKALRGPRNDIEAVKTLLNTRFGIPKAHMTTLLDKQATHGAVRAAFADLARRARPGDFVYIHYAGHGAESRDLNGDERGGKDQTWVTYGARTGRFTGEDDYDVLDDEINAWLVPILAKTSHVVFVSDSCHSASVTRGQVIGVRSASADLRPHMLGRQVFDTPDSIRGIRIGAARDRETAIEIRTADGKEHGLFTWYWLQALEQAVPGETWDDVYKRVYTLVTTHPGAYQRPQLEGVPNRAVFGGVFRPRQRTVAVLDVDARRAWVQVDAGLANGATVGSLYTLYAPGQPDPGRLATLRLKAVGVFTSEGRVEQGTFKRGDLLVETEHAYAFEPIRLYVDGDFRANRDRALVERIETSVGQLDGFTMVGNRSEAEWILYVLRPRRRDGELVYASEAHTLPESSPNAAAEVWVISPQESLLHERMRIPLADQAAGISLLRENLAKFARIQEIKRLSSVTGAVAVEMEYYLLRPDPSCREDCVGLFGPDRRRQAYRKEGPLDASQVAAARPRRGDVLGFAIRNRDTDDYYAYLINVAPGGDVQPIFPQPDHSRESARVDAGGFRDLSAKVGLMFDTPGEEYIKLIVTRRPIDVAVFRSSGYRGTTRSARATSPLERLLGEALHTRGQAVWMPEADWDTRDAVFEIGP